MTDQAKLKVDLSREAQALYASSLVWDEHSGFMPDEAADLNNLEIWSNAGVSYLSINVGFDLMPWEKSVSVLAHFRHWILGRPDRFILAGNTEDVRRAKREGKLAVTFDLEGMQAFNGRLETVEFYYQLGVRHNLFAYNRNNAAGGGCHDEDRGLTEFGRAVIDEMNRVGMVVDVSHAGYRTSMEAIERSSQPCIFSHSGARAVQAHGRNITDEQARACAAKGGVVGAIGISLFLGDDDAGPSRLADHVEHLIQVAGPAHVGLGLDYGFKVDGADIDQILAENPQFWPKSEGYLDAKVAYFSPARLLELTEELMRRGLDETTIRGVLGENFLRVAGQVWK